MTDEPQTIWPWLDAVPDEPQSDGCIMYFWWWAKSGEWFLRCALGEEPVSRGANLRECKATMRAQLAELMSKLGMAALMRPAPSPQYCAVYGATVARQVQDYIQYGNGAPDEKTMRAFVEHAHLIAQMAEAVDR